MIIKSELIKRVRDYFDLNIYETKVWLALLSKGIASAGEVAEISGVPRSRTYDVLEGLEKQGFAIVKLGKPVKYIGVKPQIILEKLKNNVMKDADERIKTLSQIKETDEFSKIETLYTQGIEPVKKEDLSAAISGKSNIAHYIKEILQNAKKEVMICMSVDELYSKFKLFQQTFDKLKSSNIKVKVALSGDLEKINELSKKLGVKIKPINLDAKFFIIDRAEILFYTSKRTADIHNAIWLNSDFFAEAFSTLFDKAISSKK